MLSAFILAITLGIFLDFVIGDPRGMPHIVRLVGWLAVVGERAVVGFMGRSVMAGLALWLGVNGVCLAGYWLLATIAAAASPWLKIALDAVIVFQCLAFRDLVKHVNAVRLALGESLEAGRKKVSWIVGRDTERMERDDVCRAAIESGAENLNDAVIAPLFWAALCGPVGCLVFRISNTLDAMVGHRDERFERLGKVSARIDDVLNFVPARLCALAILPLSRVRLWRELAPDAAKHPSFNAGWPEAGMAHRLGVVIGGRMYEKGELVQTAEMNVGARQPNERDIARATDAMGIAYSKALIAVCLVWSAAFAFGWG